MKALGLIVVTLVIGLACSSTTTARPPAQVSSVPAQANPAVPTLAQAIRASTHLGPADSGTEVFLNFALTTRQGQRLAALLAAGKTVSAADYESEFGPDPALVQAALHGLDAVGLQATWSPGSTLIEADGPAPAVAALLRIDIERYRLSDGPRRSRR